LSREESETTDRRFFRGLIPSGPTDARRCGRDGTSGNTEARVVVASCGAICSDSNRERSRWHRSDVVFEGSSRRDGPADAYNPFPGAGAREGNRRHVSAVTGRTIPGGDGGRRVTAPALGPTARRARGAATLGHGGCDLPVLVARQRVHCLLRSGEAEEDRVDGRPAPDPV
jgi:hypothetical protein